MHSNQVSLDVLLIRLEQGLAMDGPLSSGQWSSNCNSEQPHITISSHKFQSTILEDMTKMLVHISLSDIADLNYFDI